MCQFFLSSWQSCRNSRRQVNKEMEFSQHGAIIWTVVVIKSSFGFLPSPQTAHKLYIQTRHFYSLFTINFKFKAFFLVCFFVFFTCRTTKIDFINNHWSTADSTSPHPKVCRIAFQPVFSHTGGAPLFLVCSQKLW